MKRKKTSEYKIKDLIIDNNEDLFNEVNSKAEVILKKDFKIGWSAKLDKDKAIITYNYTDYPDASFTHELLHLKYELNGLRMPYVKDEENVGSCLAYLFNLLCHHKFYNEFIELGFEDDEFLKDSDSDDLKTLMNRDLPNIRKSFSQNGPLNGSIQLLMPYLALKSPHDKSETTKEYIKELKSYGTPLFFNEIDKILSDWEQSSTLNVSETFARIFKATNNPRVGFSFSGTENDIFVAGNI